MGNRPARIAEAVLLVTVVTSLGLGVTWGKAAPAAPIAASSDLPAPTETTLLANFSPTEEAPSEPLTSTDNTPPVEVTQPTATPGDVGAALQEVKTPLLQVDESAVGSNDAPLLQQAPGTINILILGSDAAVDTRIARTDTIMLASINPDVPSVSLLSFPRDLQVRFPSGRQDRINTVYSAGNLSDYPGGGAALLALVMRKNFGIRVDHFVRIDFEGFIKAIDTLGGVEVLVECELHDTFPDKTSPIGKTDLDLYPGKVTLSGKQALWYARSRWSTTDFDRARRQQKVLRATLRKAREGNLLQNALNLYADFRPHLETSIGPTDLLPLIDIARRLDDIAIKSRVITWPVVRSYQRQDGASVLVKTDKLIPFIAEALAPPSTNQAQTLPHVEVYNGSSRPDMELVAAERLVWEGFRVIGVGKVDDRFPQTQIIDYTITRKGSPIARLREIFNVPEQNVIGQPDPSSPSAARIVLGEDYNSCPNTANAAESIPLTP